MKIATLIVRILLGLAFVIFGANGFLNFIPAPMPTGVAGEFMQATMMHSHFLLLTSAVELIAGLLLLIGRYVPFALPVLANILDFHLTILLDGVAIALVVVVLWIFLFVQYRGYFASIFTSDAKPSG
jgi:putative oxidoreductase